MSSVFVKMEVSDQKRDQFLKFVEIFSTEAAHSEGAQLNRITQFSWSKSRGW